MKKIMFNDRYGLTEAVLERRKIMTRRVERIEFYPGCREEQIGKFCKLREKDEKGRQVWLGFDNKVIWIAQLISRYTIGGEVAVAQPYKDICLTDPIFFEGMRKEAGWSNKMFVKAEYMPHRIRITDIRVERLQDISDEDCLHEGITEKNTPIGTSYSFFGTQGNWETPRAAFAVLIDKVSGRGTWNRNPWVFVYTFRLVQ